MSEVKPEGSRQRRNLPAVMDADAPLVPSGVPVPPADLSEALATTWAGLWSSPVAQLLDPVGDLPAVSRLFGMYRLGEQLDAMIDAADEYDTAIVTTRIRVSTEARQLEAQLGLSPRSRLALGLALLAGRKSGSLDDFIDDGDTDDGA